VLRARAGRREEKRTMTKSRGGGDADGEMGTGLCAGGRPCRCLCVCACEKRRSALERSRDRGTDWVRPACACRGRVIMRCIWCLTDCAKGGRRGKGEAAHSAPRHHHPRHPQSKQEGFQARSRPPALHHTHTHTCTTHTHTYTARATTARLPCPCPGGGS
jgi:hypothetical protein